MCWYLGWYCIDMYTKLHKQLKPTVLISVTTHWFGAPWIAWMTDVRAGVLEPGKESDSEREVLEQVYFFDQSFSNLSSPIFCIPENVTQFIIRLRSLIIQRRTDLSLLQGIYFLENKLQQFWTTCFSFVLTRLDVIEWRSDIPSRSRCLKMPLRVLKS